jgi:hypothetical protein
VVDHDDPAAGHRAGDGHLTSRDRQHRLSDRPGQVDPTVAGGVGTEGLVEERDDFRLRPQRPLPPAVRRWITTCRAARTREGRPGRCQHDDDGRQAGQQQGRTDRLNQAHAAIL